MAQSEIKAWVIWFDSLISGWKTYISLVTIIAAMYIMDDGYAQHIVVAFGFAMGAGSRAAKHIRHTL